MGGYINDGFLKEIIRDKCNILLHHFTLVGKFLVDAHLPFFENLLLIQTAKKVTLEE